MPHALTCLLLLSASAAAQESPAPDGADALAEGDAIVVSEQRSDAPDPSETAASVTVIEVDERLPASADVAEVVDTASGTTVQRLGGLGDWAGVSIRGANVRHTQVFLDGVPLNPDGATAVNLSELPLLAFERVEIYRGNAPAAFAAAPIGGVVNLATGDRAEPVSAAAISYGALRTTRLTAFTALPHGPPEAPRGDTFLAAEGFTTEGDYSYFADNGTEYNLLDDHIRERSNNDKRQLSVHGRWRRGDDRLRVSLLESFLARDEGVAGHVNNPTSEVRLSTTRSLSVADLDGAAGAVRWRARSWGFIRREILEDPADELGLSTQHNQNQFDALGGLAHAAWAPAPWIAPSLTISARRDGYSALDLEADESTLSLSRRSLTGAAAADLRLADERVGISAVVQGLWLDNRALDFETAPDEPEVEVDANTLVHLNPRLGVLVTPWERVALKANVGHYLRPPDLTELFGDRGSIVGNPALLPEEGLQWDVGGRLVLPDGRITGSLDVAHFWNRTTNLISYIQNSQFTLVPINLEDAWVQGLEVAASFDWFGWAETQSNLTRNVSVNLSEDPAYGNNQLPRIPTWELYQRSAVTWGERVRAGHTFSYTDGNYWDRTNWYLSTPRAIHGLFVRVKPRDAGPSLELDVLNLTDRTVELVPRNPLEPEDDALVVQPLTDFVGYPLPGRTVMVTLRWAIQPTRDAP